MLAAKKDAITGRTADIGKGSKMASKRRLPGTRDHDSLEERRDFLPHNRGAHVRRLWEELLSRGDHSGLLVDEVVVDIKAGAL